MITNFLFKRGKIISRPYDYNWKFIRVTKNNRNRYLKKLLYDGIIIEKAIDPAVSNGRRFDFRVYCIYGKVVYFYARSSKVGSCVTNWSQGGEIEKKVKFSKYIPKDKIKKVQELERALDSIEPYMEK